jgi:hypothetical protein
MINDEDIIYQDNRIAILNKTCKKGVIIGSHTTDYGFLKFNIPFYVRDINYSSPVKEIISLYGYSWFLQKKRTYIRVDPEKTYLDHTRVKLSHYMKNREDMSLFRQFVYNDSSLYHISVPSCYINSFNRVPLT